MKSNEDQIKDLQVEVEQLHFEVERYRQATTDSLQQLGWCIGYLAAVRKPHVGRQLAANVARIRQGLLKRSDGMLPADAE